MTPRLLGIVLALAAAACWATAITLYKKTMKDGSAYGVNLVSHSLCFLLFLVPFAASGGGAMPGGVAVRLFASGVLGIAVGDTLFFEGLRHITPYVIMLLTLSGQVLTIVLGVVFLGESQPPAVWMGIGLVLAGLVLAMWPRRGAGGPTASTFRGVFCGLLAILFESGAIVVAKKELAAVSAIDGVMARLAGGVLGLLLIGLFRRSMFRAAVPPLLKPAVFGKIAVAALTGTFGGYWLFHAALKYTDVSVANTLNNTTPLFAIPLSYLVLREKVAPRAVAGILAAVAGIVLISR